MKLWDIAHARSGDKGDISNIAVVAYTDESFELLRKYLTPERVKEHLCAYVDGDVNRFVLPHLKAFNFVLHGSLGGGVTRSLRLDIHGKGLSSALLTMEVPNKCCKTPSYG